MASGRQKQTWRNENENDVGENPIIRDLVGPVRRLGSGVWGQLVRPSRVLS